MKNGYFETSRRDFLKASVMGGAATLTALKVPSALAQPTPPTPQPPFTPSDPSQLADGDGLRRQAGPRLLGLRSQGHQSGWRDQRSGLVGRQQHPSRACRGDALGHDPLGVGDAPTDKAAWKQDFVDFNKRHGKGAVGYKKGEKIAIKMNLNQMHNHGTGTNDSYIAPQSAGPAAPARLSRLAPRRPTSLSSTPSATFRSTIHPPTAAAARSFPASTSWTGPTPMAARRPWSI